MKNSLHIAIPQPCQEDWDKMTPTEQGAFCNVCSKCVVDFTRFSDADLLAYFSNAPKNVCGRFDNRQLNKTIEKIPVYSPWFSFPKKWMLAVGLWAGLMVKGFAQTASINPSTPQQNTVSFEIAPKTTNDSTRTIRGVVLDSATNEPLIGAVVLIKGTKTGSATDLEGTFTINLSKEYYDKEIVVELRSFGYKIVDYTISPNKDFHTLKMTEDASGMTEEVVVYHMGKPILKPNYYTVGRVADQELIPFIKKEKIDITKPTRWQRVKTFFKNLF
jgi:hypothetical protein